MLQGGDTDLHQGHKRASHEPWSMVFRMRETANWPGESRRCVIYLLVTSTKKIALLRLPDQTNVPLAGAPWAGSGDMGYPIMMMDS